MSEIVPFKVPPSFKKRLEKKTPELQAAILKCIQRLGEDTRYPGLQTHKVRGVKGVYEAYIDKANRLTFHYDEGVIVLRQHCNHDVLRRP